MDFVETKYPHDDTMKALGIFEDVELVLKNMRLAKFFSHRMESYKELTCSWRSFGFTMEREPLGIKEMSSKEYGLQLLKRILFLKVQGCSDQEACARYVHKALANTFFARKATGQSMRRGEAP
ncbi:unnamed protein product [Microthlaspi erraticum]|uniref:Arabidopsis retrotransposon Orf1 C-terminal domain-containing protein n=1 Tax=Microthlaspi erraticum TaxID=1685480 RepID=A0A6D2HZT3_9BRAS|nr:unnamed protein product [Microthlaspi erraticum]